MALREVLSTAFKKIERPQELKSSNMYTICRLDAQCNRCESVLIAADSWQHALEKCKLIWGDDCDVEIINDKCPLKVFM